MNKTTVLAILTLLIIVGLVYIKEDTQGSKNIILKENSVILAFGDSLTYGFGAESEFSYPNTIQKKIGLKIVNAGINGELSSEGLLRLPQLLRQKPDLVILCHGGNDILKGSPALVLKQNLLDMIRLIKESGGEVLLVGVPNFTLFGFDVYEIYDEVADEADVLYEDEVLTFIAKDNSLKSDYVHPNAKGYELMADAFIEILKI